MRTWCFAGPSAVGLDFPSSWERRPPIRHGDLQALAGEHPCRIVIIDGEFGQALPITVTEIRDALLRGDAVYGCSSMGALRAAECEPLGMVGTGWVTEQLRSGAVVADDEVALLYDPETYQNFTVPAVNLRWLVSCLASEGILDSADAELIRTQLHAIPFRDRTRRAISDRLAGLAGQLAGAGKVLDFFLSEPELSWNRKWLDARELTAELDG